ARHALDADGQKHVALAGLDGVRGDAGRHQRRRAVPVDRDARDVEPGKDGYHAADVVALLAARQAAAADQVLDLRRVELRNLVEDPVHDMGREVVGPDVDEGALPRSPYRRAAIGHDHCFGHVSFIRWSGTMSGFTGDIPSSLSWLEGSEAGRAWLESLPHRVEDCAVHWGLRLTAPYPYSFTSLALPARREDGTDVVLKIRFVDRETEH